MLLRRVLLLPSARRAAIRHHQSQYASSATPHEQHDHDHARSGSEHYPPEDFASPLWRNVALLSVLGVAAYKYAPEPGEDVYLTRWIAMYSPRPGLWLERNARHTAMEADASDTKLLLSSAQKPAIYRYQYPQKLDQCSPFLVPVGMNVDMKGVVAKTH